jgi:Ni,Fe-hydrogenase III small subunit
MIGMIMAKLQQGRQYIPDLKKAAVAPEFRGFPKINAGGLSPECEKICPTGAISHADNSINIGKCIFCGDCERKYGQAVKFTNSHKLASTSPESLVIRAGITAAEYERTAVKTRADIKKVFGRSLKFRQVSAAGCNGCEMELNACSNVNFDMARFGMEFVASPRHADGLVLTGPISASMASAVNETYNAIPEPRIIILTGACAISGGLFVDSPAIDRTFLKDRKIDLYVPGCPIHPLTFINGVMSLIGR